MDFINKERIPQKHRAKVMTNWIANMPNTATIADPDYDGDGEPPHIKKYTDCEWINMQFMKVGKNWNDAGANKIAAKAAETIVDIWTE